jgi:predicted dehydrogenase
MTKKIKFGIIGFGHIGRRHAEMIRRNAGAQLVAIADIDKNLGTLVKELEDVKFFPSAEAMFDAALGLDVVTVCTPNGLHAPLAIKALETGSNVVVEKPMGLTKAECEQVIFKSLQMSKQVFCVMQNRYSPPSVWLKEIVSNNRLGKILMVQINCYWNRDDRYYKKGSWKGSKELDGGPLFTQFSHFLDIMYWLFGDIKNIQARFKNFNHQTNTEFFDDSGMVNFDFVDGGMGCINYSTSVWDKNLESSITIIGEKGSVKVGGQYMDKVEVCHIKDYTMPVLAPTNPPNDYGEFKGSAANHHFVIDNVIDTLSGRSTATTNALEGLKVVDIIERIYQSAK